MIFKYSPCQLHLLWNLSHINVKHYNFVWHVPNPFVPIRFHLTLFNFFPSVSHSGTSHSTCDLHVPVLQTITWLPINSLNVNYQLKSALNSHCHGLIFFPWYSSVFEKHRNSSTAEFIYATTWSILLYQTPYCTRPFRLLLIVSIKLSDLCSELGCITVNGFLSHI